MTEDLLDKKIASIVCKSIDLHVHIGPEIIPRKYTVKKLINQEKGKIAGVALKNHFYPTMPLIKNLDTKGLKIISSVTLNNFLGGLNPEALYATSLISEDPFIVWFPTINAAAFLKKSNYEIPWEWVQKNNFKARPKSLLKKIEILNKKGKLTESTLKVLKAIKKYNCILATGHLSWQESEKLVNKAFKIGVKKVIVTHPIYQPINMPIKIQKSLAQQGAFIEQCYSMYSIDKIPIKKIAKQIKQIGSKYCFLSSDVGQEFSPNPSQALKKFAELLLNNGVTIKELKTMLVKNPRKIIRLS